MQADPHPTGQPATETSPKNYASRQNKPSDEITQKNVPCPVCFANDKGIALSAIVESPVGQWLAVNAHEKHHKEQHEKVVKEA